MDNSPVKIKLFDESHYFMCSSGLKPATFRAHPKKMYREDDNHYLNEKSLTCKGADFSCRWAAVIAAAIAALVLALCCTGFGALMVAAIIGAAALAGGLAGMALCGCLAAMAREWTIPTIKTDEIIEGYPAVANRPGVHLTCKIACFQNTIVYVPNVTSAVEAWLIFAGNVAMAGLEGYMCVYGVRGLGLLGKFKFSAFFSNFCVNWIRSATLKGAVVRVLFGGYSAINAYYMSSEEGVNGEEIGKAALNGTLFIEGAMLRLATADSSYETEVYNRETGKYEKGTDWRGAVTDGMLLSSLGGMHGRPGKSPKDATLTDIPNEAKSLYRGWINSKQTAKNEVESLKKEVKQFKDDYHYILNKARGFRNRLKSGKGKGEGGHEKEDPRNSDPKVINSKAKVRELVKDAQAKIEKAASFKEMQQIAEQLCKDLSQAKKDGQIFRGDLPSVVTIYESASGGRYLDVSYKGGTGTEVRPDASPRVKSEYDNIYNHKRGDGHGNCGEGGTYSQADAKGDLNGGRTESYHMDKKGNITTIEACESCSHITHDHNITDNKTGDVPDRPSKSQPYPVGQDEDNYKK